MFCILLKLLQHFHGAIIYYFPGIDSQHSVLSSHLGEEKRTDFCRNIWVNTAIKISQVQYKLISIDSIAFDILLIKKKKNGLIDR